MADNQLPGVKAFDDAGLIPWAGDIRDNEAFYDDAVEKLTSLLKNPDARKQQSDRMRMAIDGAGARRIADAILAK